MRTVPAAVLALGLVLAASLPGCPVPVDDDDSLDDDDSADDDDAIDDDDSAAPPGISAVTFAATMEGVEEVWPEDGGAITELSGTFHFVYWTSLEDQDLHCRQRFGFTAVAHFGDALVDDCDSCSGQLTVTQVQLLDPGGFEDSCPILPGDIDLSFLLSQEDITVPADFRTLVLLSIDDLVELEWELGVGGMAASKLVERYAVAGLDVMHVGLVLPAGWLQEEAALDDVASIWAEGGLLPMFCLYAEAQDGDPDPTLVGDAFMASLWTVRVGDGLGADVLP